MCSKKANYSDLINAVNIHIRPIGRGPRLHKQKAFVESKAFYFLAFF